MRLRPSAKRPSPGATGSLILFAIVLAQGAGSHARAEEPAPTGAAREERALLLEVWLNGNPTNKVGDFLLRDGALFATRSELRDLGIAVPGGDDAEQVKLSSLPGFRYTINDKLQQVRIELPVASLTRQELLVSATRQASDLLPTAPGAVLNYDLTATAGRGPASISGYAEGRLFGRYGVLNSGTVITSTGPAAGVTRLDTTYTYADAAGLRSYRLGDVITGGLSSSRSVRLGGAQLATDFTLNPNLVTFPVPGVAGQAAVPSTVDILVNGIRQLSSPIQPGPFFVPRVPVTSGAGTISLLVQDAAGRQTIQTVDFYSAPTLLKPGLASFSLEAGAVRKDFGLRTSNYGGAAAVATGRYGLTSNLTLEGHTEWASNLFTAQAGGSLTFGKWAAGTFLTGFSHSGAGDDLLVSAGIERTTPLYRLSASALFTGPNYRDIASLYGDPAPRRQVQLSGGVFLGALGSFGVGYTRLDRTQPTALASATPGPTLSPIFSLSSTERLSLASVTYSRQLFGRAFLYFNGYRDLHRNTTGATLGVSLRFGAHGSVSSDASYSGGKTGVSASATETAISTGQTGWRVYAAEGPVKRTLAEAEYRAPWGVFGAGVDRFNSSTFLQGRARGSLALLDRSLFASDTIQDSFIVVDAAGRSGVSVLQENRFVGRTDASGRLLIPSVRAYDTSKISIDPGDLPLDTDIGDVNVYLRAPFRSGAVAHFRLKESGGALLTLMDPDGKYVPVGSFAELSGARVPVGYDGQAYFKSLGAQNTLRLTKPDGSHCSTDFQFKPVRGELAALGPLVCRDTDPKPVQIAQASTPQRTDAAALGLKGRLGPGPGVP